MSERKHKRSFFDTPEAARRDELEQMIEGNKTYPNDQSPRTPWWFWYATAFIWGLSCGFGISALFFWLYRA